MLYILILKLITHKINNCRVQSQIGLIEKEREPTYE